MMPGYSPQPTVPQRANAGSWTRWKQAGTIIVIGVALLLAIEVIDQLMNGRLDLHGITPRTWSGLVGVLWAPLLHGDYAHLFANVVPGFVLAFFVILSGRGLAATAIIWVISGLGVWLTAASGTITVGASGIVFGWLTFLMVRGVFNRDVWQVLGGVVILAVYGSILWGVLPGTEGVSWQGHLFGAIGGIVAASVTAKDRPERVNKPVISQGGFH